MNVNINALKNFLRHHENAYGMDADPGLQEQVLEYLSPGLPAKELKNRYISLFTSIYGEQSEPLRRILGFGLRSPRPASAATKMMRASQRKFNDWADAKVSQYTTSLPAPEKIMRSITRCVLVMGDKHHIVQALRKLYMQAALEQGQTANASQVYGEFSRAGGIFLPTDAFLHANLVPLLQRRAMTGTPMQRADAEAALRCAIPVLTPEEQKAPQRLLEAMLRQGTADSTTSISAPKDELLKKTSALIHKIRDSHPKVAAALDTYREQVVSQTGPHEHKYRVRLKKAVDVVNILYTGESTATKTQPTAPTNNSAVLRLKGPSDYASAEIMPPPGASSSSSVGNAGLIVQERVTAIKNLEADLKKEFGEIFGHEEAKSTIGLALDTWKFDYAQGKMQTGGITLAIQGPPSCGKTRLLEMVCKSMKEFIKRPYVIRSLAGITRPHELSGLDLTFETPEPGLFVRTILQTKCRAPSFLLDELCSADDSMQRFLQSATDPEQNHQFEDAYFPGLPIDLSQASFFFAFNDLELVRPPLRKRSSLITMAPYSRFEVDQIFQLMFRQEILRYPGPKIELSRCARDALYLYVRDNMRAARSAIASVIVYARRCQIEAVNELQLAHALCKELTLCRRLSEFRYRCTAFHPTIRDRLRISGSQPYHLSFSTPESDHHIFVAHSNKGLRLSWTGTRTNVAYKMWWWQLASQEYEVIANLPVGRRYTCFNLPETSYTYFHADFIISSDPPSSVKIEEVVEDLSMLGRAYKFIESFWK